MKKIQVATRNRNKIREIQAIIGEAFELIPLPEEVDEVEEDGETFQENALKKARVYSALTHLPTIAEDSGLEVEALNGAPGVRSARFAGESADADANNRLLLEKLGEVPPEKRQARFVCCLIFREGTDETAFFGEVRGRIALEEAGRGGFGYDPLFIPEGHERTFAELPAEIKNGMSHRFHSLDQLSKHLSGTSR